MKNQMRRPLITAKEKARMRELDDAGVPRVAIARRMNFAHASAVSRLLGPKKKKCEQTS